MTTLGAIELPDDVQWVDEFTWLPTAHQVEVASGGSLLVEESKQLAGRPITLEGPFNGSTGFAMIPRSTVEALRVLAAETQAAPMLLTLTDARTFNVRFRHADGAFEARPLRHIAPHEAGDLYAFTLRLMQV